MNCTHCKHFQLFPITEDGCCHPDLPNEGFTDKVSVDPTEVMDLFYCHLLADTQLSQKQAYVPPNWEHPYYNT